MVYGTSSATPPTQSTWGKLSPRVLAHRRAILHASHLPSAWEARTQNGASRKLVELDSALVPMSSTLVCGAQHTPKPFQLTHTTMRLLLEPEHMQCGVGDQAQGGGALLPTEVFLQNHWLLQGEEKHGDITPGEIFLVLPHGLVQEHQPYLQKDVAQWQRRTQSGYFTFDQDRLIWKKIDGLHKREYALSAYLKLSFMSLLPAFLKVQNPV